MTAPTTPTGTLTDADAATLVEGCRHIWAQAESVESWPTTIAKTAFAAGYAAGAANEAAIIRASLAQAEREDAAGQAHPQGQGINVPREVTCPHCGMPFEVES